MGLLGGHLGKFTVAGVALLGAYCYSNNLIAKNNTNEVIEPCNCVEKNRNYTHKQTKFYTAIEKSKALVEKFQAITGAPGIVVGVTVDGKTAWEEGFGYADIENGIPCKPEAVMRIASISKSITMIAVAKLWEKGQLDLDQPVQHYVKSFPEKTYKNEKVIITGHHLVSHTSGIRHYSKDSNKTASSDGVEKEYLLNEKFATVEDSLKLFKDDDLMIKPGTGYLYTTHGWTLVSALVEAVAATPFDKYMEKLFDDLGMSRTYIDINNKLINNRARYYLKNKRTGTIENAPTVDNSYKWAGGGFLSCVSDLTRFGNIMLYSYQHNTTDATENEQKENNAANMPGFLKKETVIRLWTPNPIAKAKSDSKTMYGMGWVIDPPNDIYGFCKEQKLIVGHSGGAVGCSSMLLIIPQPCDSNNQKGVKGVVVAILTNLQDVGASKVAYEIAENFYNCN
ncbi:hypothetical protein CHUAL_000955 [Chamberlinius hualienensis]